MMVEIFQEGCKDRKTELNLLTELLQWERNRIAGTRMFSMEEMHSIAEEALNES